MSIPSTFLSAGRKLTLPFELGNLELARVPVRLIVAQYPSLSPSDFRGNELLKDGRAVVFLYAGWCPFCRRSIAFLRLLKPNSDYIIYRADISNRGNPLWVWMKISAVPTLIAFKNHKEIWRKDGILGTGLAEGDFLNAHMAMVNRK